MACSDNVVRAGLTPKLKDSETLCAMLSYETGAAHVQRGEPTPTAAAALQQRVYRGEAPEFRVVRVELAGGAADQLAACDGPSLLLCVDGGGSLGSHHVTPGSVLFLPHLVDVPITADAGSPLVLYRAASAPPPVN
jgi:mannose-6-phosphate isomerase